MDRRVAYEPLAKIRSAPRNAKRHDTEGIGSSIAEFGLAELPLIDERTGRLVAGHGRVDDLCAKRGAGEEPPDGVLMDEQTGDWLVPVIRGWASRDDAHAEAYAIASNRLTERGGWDDPLLTEALSAMAEEGLLALTGFTDADLAALLDAGSTEDLGTADAGGDSAPSVPKHPKTEPGDLWLLGTHRLMCGDATNPDDLDRLLNGVEPGIVYTDPPYGIDIVSDAGKVGHHRGMPFGGLKGSGKVIRTTEYLPVAGDDTTDAARDAFAMLLTSWPKALHIWWGGNHYAQSAGLPDSPCWLVWDKQTNGNFADCELAWTNHPGAVRIFRHMWNGMLRDSERGKRVHPTQKPAALAVWAFDTLDAKSEHTTVLDVFGGSGSTLLAAHDTKRTAYVMELEPAYVDVICRRFQEKTGITPIHDGTGEQVSFVAEDEDQ